MTKKQRKTKNKFQETLVSIFNCTSYILSKVCLPNYEIKLSHQSNKCLLLKGLGLFPCILLSESPTTP